MEEKKTKKKWGKWVLLAFVLYCVIGGAMGMRMAEQMMGGPAGGRFCPRCRKMVQSAFCPDCGTQTV
jgi:hypothetical protein